MFYPSQSWTVAGSNPHRRLSTGGAGEFWVLAIRRSLALRDRNNLLLIFGIWIADNGGIFQNLGQNLGLSNTVIEVYNQNASTNHVYARDRQDFGKAIGQKLMVGI